MKHLVVFSLWLFLTVTITSARTVSDGSANPHRRIDPVATDTYLPEMGIAPRVSANDTTFLAYFTFDSGPNCVNEGWTSFDFTAQTHDFWHVAGPVELDGGTFGRLTPLEGNQSLWCGASGPVTAAEDRVLCSYATLPGYGNNWDQSFCLKNCLTDAVGVVLNASVMWDSEPSYDYTIVEIDNCDDDWVEVYGGNSVWDGVGSDTISLAIPDSLHSGQLRIRFFFHSDVAYSDQDGIRDSDGAFLLDQLSVSDTSGVRVAYEDFEDETPGDTEADDWRSYATLGYGDYAALYKGNTLVQEDPCISKLDCVWTFFTGSTSNYACGGWPEQLTVPYVNARGQYIHNAVISPDIAVSGSGSDWEISFDVYRDLSLNSLVFYQWYVRSVDATGCPGEYRSDRLVRYGDGKDWYRATFELGQYIDSGATHIGVALAARDMCEYWCGINGDGSCHSHAPLFDNVEVYRVSSDGPRWVLQDIYMFQDNFSEYGTITGTARADMAADILPSTSAGIRPGDSVCVDVSDPDNGLDYHISGVPSSGPAVYLFCSVDGPSSGETSGLLGDARYNYVGTVVAGGRSWCKIQMDSTWNSFGILANDRYNVDLNDNLFVPGDTVWFFFGASSADIYTYSALSVPEVRNQTLDINVAATNPDEFTILPAAGYKRGGDWLYVDGMNFRGEQIFFDTAFEQLEQFDLVDRFDIRGPSSAVGNHPGSRVTAITQLLGTYDNIIWSCGDLETALGDGTGTVDKSDDTGLLYNFMEYKPSPGGGIYLSGDDVADVLLNKLFTPLKGKYISIGGVLSDHEPIFGLNPLVVGKGNTGCIFQDNFGVDTLVAYGGCPSISDLDVITPTGGSVIEASYHGGGATGGAIISDTTTNVMGQRVGFVLSGFGYSRIRDARAGAVPARSEHLYRIMAWLQNVIDYPVGARPTTLTTNELSQNYPNPFNPVTTVKYQIKTDGLATLRIYNVAGQLVHTLVDGYVKSGVVHEAQWRGLNDAGQTVSSGVYFYKLVTAGYVETKKMVLLK